MNADTAFHLSVIELVNFNIYIKNNNIFFGSIAKNGKSKNISDIQYGIFASSRQCVWFIGSNLDNTCVCDEYKLRLLATL